MAKTYKISEVCGDWALHIPPYGKMDEEMILIFNSRSNAELVKSVLEWEDAHPNAAVPYMPTLTPPNEWVSVEDELPKLPDCDKCSMMVNTARKGNPKSFPMIYERAIVRGKRVERWKYYWDRIADEPPDYWMYLPKPPTKET